MNTLGTGTSNNASDSEVWSRSWTHFRVDRRSPRYCHVTFDHPPINTITATTVAELSDIVGLIEQDPKGGCDIGRFAVEIYLPVRANTQRRE